MSTTKIPKDLVFKIVGYSSWDDVLLRQQLVCKMWRSVCRSNEIWDMLSCAYWKLDFDLTQERFDNLNLDIGSLYWYEYFNSRLYKELSSTKTRVASIRNFLDNYEVYPNKKYLERITELIKEEMYKPNDAFLESWIKSAYNDEKRRTEFKELLCNVYVTKYKNVLVERTRTIECEAKLYTQDGDQIQLFYELEKTTGTLQNTTHDFNREIHAEMYYEYTSDHKHVDKSKKQKKNEKDEKHVSIKITYGDDSDESDDDEQIDRFNEGDIIAQIDHSGHADLTFNDQLQDESTDDTDESDGDFLDFERRTIMECEGLGNKSNRRMKINQGNLQWLFNRFYPNGSQIITKENFYYLLLVRMGGEQGFIY
ncbi:F-box/LRR-repeat protein [Acrasis kona]|uniref:F-box/LRR-repeat protein n=1 Tax=Acrasis kona TaxID=1008807 RepID=A0AAW2ZRR8_9EUKA